MRLYTINPSGVVDMGIVSNNVGFVLGEFPNGHQKLVQVLNKSGCSWRIPFGVWSNGYLISKNSDNTNEVGLLIRCQATIGQRWWLRGAPISVCPLTTEKSEYFIDAEDCSPTECPFCYYSTDVAEHRGYVFDSEPLSTVELIQSGFIESRGPEDFLKITGDAVFSIHKLFVPDEQRDVVVEVRDGAVSLWTPQRWFERLTEPKPEITI